jgi:hypothetical protein
VNISFVVLVLALIVFLLDTVGISSRINLTALGLALLTLAFVLGAAL